MVRRALLLLLALLCARLLAGAEQPPEPKREFRGAWVASVFNLNWPSKAGLPVPDQQRELRELMDRAVSLHLNALLLQVRPSCDALYASSLEPWSGFLTGHMGQAPAPLYDPLAFAVSEAHTRGLELHAWVNPFRALASKEQGVSDNHVSKTHPEWIRPYSGQLLLDPGEPEARAYVLAVLIDIVRRYDIDGLHIDDYFYPYPDKQRTAFPDDASFRHYGGRMARDDWRRQNIDRFVETLYAGIKAEKQWVKFGISPFGIWRPRVPATIEAQLDSYAQLYADSRRWLNEGWCDYFSPQLYWSIQPAAQSFPVLLEWWRGENVRQRHLWPGIAPERIGAKRPASEIVRQIGLTREGSSAAGVVHWSIKSLLQDSGGIDALLRDGIYRETALVPASPWLSKARPEPPSAERHGGEIVWSAAGDQPVRWWAVQMKRETWSLRVLPGEVRRAMILPGTSAVAVRAIDRFGNASAPAMVDR